MKFKKLGRTILSVLVIVSMLASIPVFAEEPESEQQYTITEPYEYPVVPGTPEWEALKNNVEKIEACVVPEEILTNMSTEALIETIMNYPLLGHFFAFNTLDAGFETVSRRLNALQELTTREDGASNLLKRLQRSERPMLTSDESNLLEVGQRALDINVLEILLAQDVFQAQLGDDGIKLFENILNEIYSNNAKGRSGEVLLYSPEASAYNRILIERERKIIAPTYVTYVNTPVGNPVTAIVEPEGFTSYEQREAMDALLMGEHPNAKFCGMSTTKYNCHSYAWHLQALTNPYRIDNPSKYMTDGSYSQVASAANKNRLFYDNSNLEKNHSAYAISTSKFVSKWGYGPLMEHSYDDCPEYEGYTKLRYYSPRY